MMNLFKNATSGGGANLSSYSFFCGNGLCNINENCYGKNFYNTSNSFCAFSPTEGATHIDTSYNVRRVAFTLAEVLITLGIIGVVAALTMPALIANYQKQQTIVKLKKVYSVISQAYEMSVNENGDSDYWNIGGSDNVNLDSVKKYVQTYWLPYFKSIQECSKSGDCSYDVPARTPSGGAVTLVGNNRYSIILEDGTLIAFVPFDWTEDEGQFWGSIQRFYIDLNGAKGPNVSGKDVFILQLSNHRITGYCYGNKVVNSSCRSKGDGWCCAAKIMQDGWEIKDDYPW